MAIVMWPSWGNTTFSPDVIGRLDEAFGGKSYSFGGPMTFWYGARLRASRELWGVQGLIEMLGVIRGNMFREAHYRSRLSDVWFREKKR